MECPIDGGHAAAFGGAERAQLARLIQDVAEIAARQERIAQEMRDEFGKLRHELHLQSLDTE
jgi:hypothetical protein